MTTEEQIKDAARAVGFDQAGITSPAPPNHAGFVQAWLRAKLHGEMGYLERNADLRAGPLNDRRLLENTRSVIVVALSYHQAEVASAGTDVVRGTIARYARGADYHPLMWEKLNHLAAQIEQQFPGTKTRGFADSGPLRERELAQRAGLGWAGKHTNLISLDLGNWFFLGALLTTLPLTPDPPFTADHCGTCTRCIAACPTGAILGPRTLDARRCISYLTIELRSAIARELRPLMGERIFGCDDCLAACPWNERARIGQENRFAARTIERAHPDLLGLLATLATDEGFQAQFANTPLLRPKRAGLRRNVCVALGNVAGDDAVLPLSTVLKTDPSPLVRGHAAWALGAIAARHPTAANHISDVLKNIAATETDESVREEIIAAQQHLLGKP